MTKTYRVLVSFESLTAGGFFVAEETERLAALVAAGYLAEAPSFPRGATLTIISAEEEAELPDAAPALVAAARKIAARRVQSIPSEDAQE